MTEQQRPGFEDWRYVEPNVEGWWVWRIPGENGYGLGRARGEGDWLTIESKVPDGKLPQWVGPFASRADAIQWIDDRYVDILRELGYHRA